MQNGIIYFKCLNKGTPKNTQWLGRLIEIILLSGMLLSSLSAKSVLVCVKRYPCCINCSKVLNDIEKADWDNNLATRDSHEHPLKVISQLLGSLSFIIIDSGSHIWVDLRWDSKQFCESSLGFILSNLKSGWSWAF